MKSNLEKGKVLIDLCSQIYTRVAKRQGMVENSEINGMTCSACVEVGQTRLFHFKKLTFTSSSLNFRLSIVSDQKTPYIHLKSKEIVKARIRLNVVSLWHIHKAYLPTSNM